MNQMTLVQNVITDLNGATPAELRNLGVKSPSKVVSRLRRSGVCVFTNRTNAGTVYKVGTPSKRMIAMAFSTAGPRAFM